MGGDTREHPRTDRPTDYCDVVLAYLRERVWNPAAEPPLREWQQMTSLVRMIVRERTPTANLLLAEDDLVQEGVFAVIRAAEQFDESRGVPWQAYVRRFVRQALADVARDCDPISREDRSLFARTRRAIEHAYAEGQTAPTVAFLAQHCDVPVDRMHGLLRTVERAYSPVDISDHDAAAMPGPSAEDIAVPRADVLAALRVLSERDRAIVWARYAEDTPAQTIAARHSISVGRVSQITSRAVAALRGHLSAG